MPDFKSYVTLVGTAKIAAAITAGTAVDLTEMAIGDGGGSVVEPTPDMETLVNEVARVSLTGYSADTESSTIEATAVISASVGGWTIRELGLYDAEGDLIAVCNYPDTVKPVLTDGVASDLVVGMNIAVASTEAVTLAVDPSKVLATREYADSVVSNHEGKSDPHSQYAPKVSPIFTGTPTAPTPASADNSLKLATTAFVKAALAALVDSSPAALDTLNELAAALGDDPNFATTMTNALAGKLNSDSYTAADVLAKIKSVDGAGSGVDCDLVRGLPANFTIVKNINGRQENPSGFFEQWVRVTVSIPPGANEYDIVLPVAFPVLMAFCVANIANTNNNVINYSAGANGTAALKVYVSNTGGTTYETVTITCFAIGY
ncbi:MAG: phage tail protein [Deferribacterales bacterium]